jgi:hypothetical protein
VSLLVSALLARAAADDIKIGSSADPGSNQPKSVIKEQFDTHDQRVGKGDWVVRGPIVDSFRKRPKREDRSFGQRIRELPIVRLFVPKPMPSREDTEVFFVEGQSSRPWSAIASDARRIGSPENPRHLEGGCALVSIGR